MKIQDIAAKMPLCNFLSHIYIIWKQTAHA